MSAGERRERSLNPYEFYMQRRLARLKLSLARILLGFVFGFAAGMAEPALAVALSITYLLVAIAAIGYCAKPRMPLLRGSEPYYVGVLSGLAAFAIGLIMGSAF
jgi:hypothetical protein